MLIAGNWKMNGTSADLATVREIAAGVPGGIDAVLCVPATLLHRAVEAAGDLPIGGEDCHSEERGAHTGDVSAPMLADAGARYVIVGHSERRTDHGETDEMVAAKAKAAHDAGLISIVCIGESEAQRERGETLDVLERQLRASLPDCATGSNTVVAYEPIWAIGTGKTASTADVDEAHGHIRRVIAEVVREGANDVAILYGGSVKPGNAGELMGLDSVDGALVGGASLKASDFLAICAAAAKRS